MSADYLRCSPAIFCRQCHGPRQSGAAGRHVENSRVESHCKVPVAGCPLYLRLDRTVVAACRPASVAGLPAHFTEEKRGVFLPSLLFTGYSYGLFCSMSCPLFYTMNSTGPGRAVAIVYYTFLLISFAVFFYWLGFIVRKLQMRQNTPEKIAVLGKLKIARYVAMTVLLAVILFTGVWQETSAAKAIRMLTNGEAAAYAAEYEERLLLLNNPEITDVVLMPFIHQPAMIYTGDLPGDPEDPTSKKTAQYFGKNSIYVDYSN